MKKSIKIIMIILLSSICTISNSQNVYIPDIVFKNYLLSRTDSINIDNDKENISLQEAINFKGRINIKSKKIQDLTGIEKFINITYINCESNYLKTITITNNIVEPH